MKLSVDQVETLAQSVLLKYGCDEENARAVAKVITAAEADHSHSHGLFRLPGYIASLKSGKVNGAACPAVTSIAPAVLRCDGDDGYAPLAHSISRQPLAECARQNGIAALGIVRTFHFAALWYEVTALAEEGLVAFAFTSYKPAVAPAGGRSAVFGTNPMAFAWPRQGKLPLVFDQASAAMARGDIQIAARDGHDVPPGTGLDANGNPTTDPKEILKGVQLAFGGHKGSAIALMVELLAGPLIGETLSIEAKVNDNNDGGPPRGGELIIALDPARFGDPDRFGAHAELLFSDILKQQGTRLPADRRYVNRRSSARDGVEINDALYGQIVKLLD